MIPLPSIFIAEHILWRRDRDNITTSPMQLLKLVYLSHGWMLGVYEKELIKDRIEAWQYGPVIPQLYHLYKVYGGDNIVERGIDHSEDIGDEKYIGLVNRVLGFYKGYSAVRLSSITHENNSPWDLTVRRVGIGAVIDNDLIREYYTKYIYDFLTKQ